MQPGRVACTMKRTITILALRCPMLFPQLSQANFKPKLSTSSDCGQLMPRKRTFTFATRTCPRCLLALDVASRTPNSQTSYSQLGFILTLLAVSRSQYIMQNCKRFGLTTVLHGFRAMPIREIAAKPQKMCILPRTHS